MTNNVKLSLLDVNQIPVLQIALETGTLSISSTRPGGLQRMLDELIDYFSEYLQADCWLFNPASDKKIDSVLVTDHVSCSVVVHVQWVSTSKYIVSVSNHTTIVHVTFSDNPTLSRFINTLTISLSRICDMLFT